MTRTGLDEPTPLEAAVLAEAFQQLLETAGPVAPARLAEALHLDASTVEEALGELVGMGRMRRAADGAVLGSLGLSVEPTVHEFVVDGTRRFYTWCAFDALGILGALGASGEIRSTSPRTGGSIRVTFVEGRPRASGGEEPVLFIAALQPCQSVIDEWCPLVNLFEQAKAARAWAAERGVEGHVVPLDQATTLGAETWRPRIVRRAVDENSSA